LFSGKAGERNGKEWGITEKPGCFRRVGAVLAHPVVWVCRNRNSGRERVETSETRLFQESRSSPGTSRSVGVQEQEFREGESRNLEFHSLYLFEYIIEASFCRKIVNA
jgi:hypothetical protein